MCLLGAIAGAAALAALAGCAATSSTTGGDSGVASVASTTTPIQHHPPARAPRHRRPQPPPRRPPWRIPVSAAGSTIVQPQPPADSCHARGSGTFALPDPRCTPGAISAAVTQGNLDATICRSGYTRTVRPPESVTEPEKLASMAAYGDSGSPHEYEYDHLVPLELGGAPNDPRNLWPEPGGSPNAKDRLEDRLRKLVCEGQLDLVTAQRQVATSWVAAYRRLFG